jgi:hypothetical protein
MTGPRTLLPASLDVYGIAHLAGGPERVADTAVVALLGHGLLRMDPAGRLQAVGRPGGWAGRHPAEAAVLSAVGPRPRWSATTVRRRAAADPRVADVGHRLAAEGLLRRNPFARLREGWPRLLRTGAGRRVLDQWAAERVAAGGGTEAEQVAVRGPAGMADRVLHDSVFGGPARRPSTRARAGALRYLGEGGSSTAYLGWGCAGFSGGDGGGGGWGGDGGGCGGGDGGGGGC